MEFLTRFFRYSRSLWNSIINYLYTESSASTEIPESIARNERLVRGVFHHIHFKKEKVQETLFLPPTGRQDVSLLRHNYTTDNFCKNFFSTMQSSQTYKGLFVILAMHVEDIAKKYHLTEKVRLRATPLDENKMEVLTRPIYVTATGLPMHADLLYAEQFRNGEIQTEYRQFARDLVKTVNRYLPDPNISSSIWEGEDLKSVNFPELS